MVKWIHKHRMRIILKHLTEQLQLLPNGKVKENVASVCKIFDATEIMTRSLKPHENVTLSMTRGELASFIRYTAKLHSNKLSQWQEARIGLAVLLSSDRKLLFGKPKEILKHEAERALKGLREKYLNHRMRGAK